MSDDTVINRTSIKHAYQQIADATTTRIIAGQYTIKLPSERDLAEEFGVSYITVRHATAILRERHLIVSIHGRGTYVASALSRLPCKPDRPDPSAATGQHPRTPAPRPGGRLTH